jgi:hypothetical protein
VVDAVRIRRCEFVDASDILPEGWKGWFWGAMCQAGDLVRFSWGGQNNRTLVTASRFLEVVRPVVDLAGELELIPIEVGDEESIPLRIMGQLDRFEALLEILGEMYIDLEN